MTEIANSIELVVHPGGAATLYVNDQEFPWQVVSDGLEVSSEVGGMPYLQVLIPAKFVRTRFESPTPETGQTPFGKVGDIFVMDPDTVLPGEVWAIRQIDPDCELEFAIREMDGWFWREDVNDTSQAFGPHTWNYLTRMWKGQDFEIVRVGPKN